MTQGLFSIYLGDASVSNMQPIPWAVFTNSDVFMRIWLGESTNGFVQLSPDQRLRSVAYAMMAANLPDQSLTSNKLAPGAVLSQNLANGAVTSAQLAPNSVTIPAILNDRQHRHGHSRRTRYRPRNDSGKHALRQRDVARRNQYPQCQ